MQPGNELESLCCFSLTQMVRVAEAPSPLSPPSGGPCEGALSRSFCSPVLSKSGRNERRDTWNSRKTIAHPFAEAPLFLPASMPPTALRRDAPQLHFESPEIYFSFRNVPDILYRLFLEYSQ